MTISKYLGIILSLFLAATTLPLKAIDSDDDKDIDEILSRKSSSKKNKKKPLNIIISSSKEKEEIKKKPHENNKKQKSKDEENECSNDDLNKNIFIPSNIDPNKLESFRHALLDNVKTLAKNFNDAGTPGDAQTGMGLTPSRALIALSTLLMDESECAAIFMSKQENKLWVGVNKSGKSLKKIMKSLKNLLQSNVDANRADLLKNEDVKIILGYSSSKDRASKEKVNEKIADNADHMIHWLKKIIGLRDHLNEDSALGFIANCLINRKINHLKAFGPHAEMNLLNELYKKNRLHEGGYLAISKQCCCFCAAALQAVNNSWEMDEVYQANGSHLNIYPYWKVPDFIKNEESILKEFIGEEAFNIYKGNPDYKEEFIDAIQSQEKKVVHKITRQTATTTDSLTKIINTSDEDAPSINKGAKNIPLKVVDRFNKKDKRKKNKKNKNHKKKKK